MMGRVWFGGDSTTGQKHTSLSGQGFRLADLSGSPKFRGRARWQVPADEQELRRGEALAQVRALAKAFPGFGAPPCGCGCRTFQISLLLEGGSCLEGFHGFPLPFPDSQNLAPRFLALPSHLAGSPEGCSQLAVLSFLQELWKWERWYQP